MKASIAHFNSPNIEATYGHGSQSFTLATGSPGELGLLQELGEAFDKKAGARLAWIKAGSGFSLKLLKAQQVDMIMVHAPDEVLKAIAEGWATGRTLIGSNEFYIVGPKADVAKIKSASSGADAYAKIAKAKANFISRGDQSGTHQKEIEIWRKAGITPEGDWYIGTHDFMTASLKRANKDKAYFMTDSSTWVAEKNIATDLQILYRGDPCLVNTYDALVAPVGATKNRDIAAKFIQFVASDEGQTIIRNYGKAKYKEALYNDTVYAKQYIY
ncbi:MAG: ABC transporter substrate-binding protein [Polynucleobacter sp. 24-46-87]|jgi:tungstate transport system substrate-binding protein|uniref:substrate-binding domain-containing protein n=1 Tax=unclassified Polynucleobacter TaxID=2640945 RepID=UPI000BD9ECDF|nr:MULTISPECIES: substrate-binding domain-containing protein [unclassified Polynucleobacter]OYY19354.1 MAG: ABC transporter substrate-binding protein [Polynucleobacter sp. 35-46-11]OZA15202.1 MAG: ABC transporter substrate-binding protein [Polynucleobacter sp. 24-46-87]OZA76790.1 MAG: ABC transporter substrate-binding protein [Polynucleobacter sp. 39-46-10]